MANTLTTLDANRCVSIWVVTDFSASNYINQSEGTTHFKLGLVTTFLIDYTFNTLFVKYEAIIPVENVTNGISLSIEISIVGIMEQILV